MFMRTLLYSCAYKCLLIYVLCITYVSFAFIHSIVARSRLFAKFIETVLRPELYDATLVGSSYSIKAYTHGLMLSLSGLRGTMPQLISNVASSKLTLFFTYWLMIPLSPFLVFSRAHLIPEGALFNTAKAALIDKLRNFNYTHLAFRYTYQYLQQ